MSAIPGSFARRRNIIAAVCLSILPLPPFIEAGVDLHICSISSNVVNTTATGAIAMLDNIYDTSNNGLDPPAASIDRASIPQRIPGRWWARVIRVTVWSAPSYRFADPPVRASTLDLSLSTHRKSGEKSLWRENCSSAATPRKCQQPVRSSRSCRIREMTPEGVRATARVSCDVVTRERITRACIVCDDSHWDNESFVAGVILHVARKGAAGLVVTATLPLRIIKIVTGEIADLKSGSRGSEREWKLTYAKSDKFHRATN